MYNRNDHIEIIKFDSLLYFLFSFFRPRTTLLYEKQFLFFYDFGIKSTFNLTSCFINYVYFFGLFIVWGREREREIWFWFWFWVFDWSVWMTCYGSVFDLFVCFDTLWFHIYIKKRKIKCDKIEKRRWKITPFLHIS